MRVLATGLLPYEADNAAETGFLIAEDDDLPTLGRWFETGLLLEAYIPVEAIGKVLLLDCRDAAEAEQLVAQLPTVQQKLLRYTVQPLEFLPGLPRRFPADASPGFLA